MRDCASCGANVGGKQYVLDGSDGCKSCEPEYMLDDRSGCKACGEVIPGCKTCIAGLTKT